MKKNKFILLLLFTAFLSLCFFTKPVWADSSSAVKKIVIQTSPDFQKKDSTPTQIASTDVTIYAFTTNNGEGQPKPAPGKIELTLTLTNAQGQQVVVQQKLQIDSGKLSGSVPVQFPTEGKWTISATGTIDGNPLSSIDITTNTEIVYIGTPFRLSVLPQIANINVNQMQQFTANLIYSDGHSDDITNEVSWTVQALGGVASIDSNGLAKGLNSGMAVIKAYDPVSRFFQYAVLFVAPNIIEGDLTVTPLNAKVGVGGTQQFKASATISIIGIFTIYLDVTPLVSWKSLSSDIASIGSPSSPRGLATGLSPGKTQIVATLPLFNDAESTLEVEGLKLSPLNPTIPEGGKQSFVATLVNPDKTEIPVTNSASWTIPNADAAVASIDNKGVATGISLGTATITATYQGMSVSTTLTVDQAALTINPPNQTISVGGTQQYQVMMTHFNQPPEDVTSSASWTIPDSDAAVASIDNRGVVTGKAPGTATITATYQGMSVSATLTVVDQWVLRIDPQNQTISIGETQQYIATVIHFNQQTEDVTNSVQWSSSDPSIANISQVNNQVIATGSSPGTVTITATYNGIHATATLNVDMLMQLMITPQNKTISIGGTQDYTVTVTHFNQQTENVTSSASFISSDSTIASVNNNVATGNSAGTVTVTASYEGLQASATLNVVFNPYNPSEGPLWERELPP
ncbi:Ig-like domain-containing protein [Desulfitobacterium sp. Sab5]|uniref:Ig-like domain-containing protein n=1 Tax=Desulfitobacterium nosdiversum TaxID=3375356 RepID=UPI003CF29552